MEPSSEPRRHAQSPVSLRLFYYTAPWVDKSCLGAASARERRRLDHQGPRSTSHSSGAALGHPERPPGASQGPAGPHEGCVRGTASGVSRVKGPPHALAGGLKKSLRAHASRCRHWSLLPACRAPALTVAAARSRTPSPRPLLRPRPIASGVDRSTLDATWCRAGSRRQR